MKGSQARLVMGFVLLAGLFAAGWFNLTRRIDPQLSFSEDHGSVRMQGISFSPATLQSGLQDGDLVDSLNALRITSAEQARWAACRQPEGPTLPIVVRRDGQLVRLELDLVPTFTPVTLTLMLSLGIMFSSLGLLVWYHGDRRATANAYSRASVLVGIAFLLADTTNVFSQPLLHVGYGVLWILVYGLLPAGLIDYTQRFCRITLLPGHPWLSFKGIYLPGFMVATVLSVAFVRIETGLDHP
ncbi:MAG: hypothetical protein Q8O14_11580 [bacterium]|nr:hypothetical protein [bacterium]